MDNTNASALPFDPAALQASLIEDLGIGSLSAEEQDRIVSKIGENILRRLVSETLDILPEENKDEFVALTEQGTPEMMMSFLSSMVPDFDAFFRRISKEEFDAAKAIIAAS